MGVNSRLDEIQAAILDVKLKHLDDETQHRRQIADLYMAGINNSLIELPKVNKDVLNDQQHVWHVFVIRSKHRMELQKYLAENGVQTLIHYPIPPHKQQAYEEWNGLSYPVSEQIHAEILSLPMGPTLTVEDAEKVIQLCNEFKV